MVTATEEQVLRKIVKEEVSGALKKEMMKLRLLLAEEISDEEQKEIEKLQKTPIRKAARAISIK